MMSQLETCDLCHEIQPLRRVHYDGRQFLCRKCRTPQSVGERCEMALETEPDEQPRTCRRPATRRAKNGMPLCQDCADFYADWYGEKKLEPIET